MPTNDLLISHERTNISQLTSSKFQNLILQISEHRTSTPIIWNKYFYIYRRPAHLTQEFLGTWGDEVKENFRYSILFPLIFYYKNHICIINKNVYKYQTWKETSVIHFASRTFGKKSPPEFWHKRYIQTYTDRYEYRHDGIVNICDIESAVE